MPFSDTTTSLEFLGQGLWRVLAPFTYTTPDGKRQVCVPKGFITDLASVPRIFWNILPPAGDYLPAAVVHDYLYTCQGYAVGPLAYPPAPEVAVDDDGQIKEPGRLSKSQVDWLFLGAMEELGISPLCRNVIWAAVYAFGWWAWLT